MSENTERERSWELIEERPGEAGEAASSRLTLVLPSTRRQLLDFLRRAGRGLGLGLIGGVVFGVILGLTGGVVFGVGSRFVFELRSGLVGGLVFGLSVGLSVALVFGLGLGLLETRSVLIASRTPREESARSMIAALTWMVSGLVSGLVAALVLWGLLGFGLGLGMTLAPVFGLGVGLDLALRSGGWFVLLQKVAHRRLARAGSLPPRPYDFLEWGIEKQIFRRVGGGVRFRHGLIQQHLANASESDS
jgi:hypothetical protein